MADNDTPKPVPMRPGGMSRIGEGVMRRQIEAQTKADRDQWTSRQIGKPPSYKRGGRVKKTGLAKVHKGEVVIPAKKAKAAVKKMAGPAARKAAPRRPAARRR